MPRWLPFAAVLLLPSPLPAQAFKLAPALALEAEDFQIQSGWKSVPNGRGNYMVDAAGCNHVSGERLLCVDGKDDSATAFLDVTLPEAGAYRLWVRYEYPAFCEARFRVQIEQGGKTVFDHLMGAKDRPRLASGDARLKPQYDAAGGPDGLVDEPVMTPELKAGMARVYLKAAGQPQAPGVAAGRHIDLLYLTRDLTDAWLKHYSQTTRPYPLLDAFRDSLGPRYEARFTNKSAAKASYSISHVYNRLPWGAAEGVVARDVPAGASSDWIALRRQDTTHFGLAQFTGSGGAFDVAIRPAGGAVEKTLNGAGSTHVYLPPYPGKGDRPVTPEEQLDAILKHLAETPKVGKAPTRPLCYAGWLPLGRDDAYGRKYAQLYAALGFRALHPAHSGPAWKKNLEAVGVPLSKSWAVSAYRNPPLPAGIEAARNALAREGMDRYVLWFDYGDEIGFSEWMGFLAQAEVDRAKANMVTLRPEDATRKLWQEWLVKNRRGRPLGDYWLNAWGAPNVALLRPDSSSAAAEENPRLYVDSLLFYEQTSIAFVAEGARAVRTALGADVLCGASSSCQPFCYPGSTTCIKWFRDGAADLGRHGDYFWQAGQAGPMVNGYVAEHFRSGMRYNPQAVLRQYTMPHSPGNTDASFLRSCFSHLAHGAKMLDFFGIGLNETYSENYIDHRDRERFRAIRDVTHAVGLVEDLLPDAQAVASPVALLVSAGTERWDFAGVARDLADRDQLGPDFRKTRLNHHLDRLGIWQALTFLGVSPDLLIEEDVTPRVLKDYKVLVVVGDCLPPELAGVIEGWVRQGGVLLGTANAGRYDAYRQPAPAWQLLFGLETRRTEERTTFFRPRQELPFLRPLDLIKGDGWEMPQLGTLERLGAARDVEVLARCADGDAPAFVRRKLGKGSVFYVAAQPGVAYLWSALQPPAVPDRGPGTHAVPTAFDAGARELLRTVLNAAGAEPTVVAEPPLIDARLLKAPKGYVLPLANYHDKVGQKVTLTIRVDGTISKAVSAYHGELKVRKNEGAVVITIPALGYGDVVRLTEN